MGEEDRLLIVFPTRIELVTPNLGNSCSIQLSYGNDAPGSTIVRALCLAGDEIPSTTVSPPVLKGTISTEIAEDQGTTPLACS